jgi:hypothetical protein
MIAHSVLALIARGIVRGDIGPGVFGGCEWGTVLWVCRGKRKQENN